VLFAALGFVGIAGYQDLGGQQDGMQDVVTAQDGSQDEPGNDWAPADGGQQDGDPPGNEW
jgi:hypothetical protein